MPEILYVPLSKLDELWPRLSPFIGQAIDYGQGEYTLADVEAEIRGLRMQLWAVVGNDILAAVTTRISQAPRRRILQVVHIGGSGLLEWGEELHRRLSEFGKDQGCDMLQVYGRTGWARVLQQVGYRQQYTVMGLEL